MFCNPFFVACFGFNLQENEFIKQRLTRGNVRYIWTSGRKCNFAGCDRSDLQPPNENGWFWSGSGAKIGLFFFLACLFFLNAKIKLNIKSFP